MTTKVYLSWDQVSEGVKTMYFRTVTPGSGFRRIIAVARGGLIPAVMLAHQLGIRRVETIRVYARNNDQSALQIPVVMGFPPERNEPRTIIVEDIVDTGRTLKVLNDHYPEYPVLALVSRRPEVMGAIAVDPQAWVVFPWEVE